MKKKKANNNNNSMRNLNLSDCLQFAKNLSQNLFLDFRIISKEQNHKIKTKVFETETKF